MVGCMWSLVVVPCTHASYRNYGHEGGMPWTRNGFWAAAGCAMQAMRALWTACAVMSYDSLESGLSIVMGSMVGHLGLSCIWVVIGFGAMWQDLGGGIGMGQALWLEHLHKLCTHVEQVTATWCGSYQVVGMQIWPWRCAGSMESLQNSKQLIPKSSS
uniref:Uncharacterized protein n=1 Tax=Fagus sylvatica TaxID=28930 RepID=A0A2N9F1F2_FAGSY